MKLSQAIPVIVLAVKGVKMPKFNKIVLEKYVKPSKFLKLQQGDNRIRILDEPYLYQVVGKKTANGFVRHILEEGVPIPKFLEDATPKTTWGFVVYSHDSEHYHVIEAGPMLGDALTQLIKAREDYKAHDIIIHKTGEMLKTVYTCEFAEEDEKLPAGASKDHPEFQFINSYFK